MRKIKINPKYEYLRDFIESIPDVFEQEGRVIYTGRNLIKVLTAPDGTQINIKRFHEPHGPNKLIYSWNIRKPKGQRAFEYPMILKKKGINTPEPLALIEERNFLNLLGYSYLITIQCDYGHTLYEVVAVEVVHPLGIAGIPVPKQFPRSQFCFGKLFAVGIDPFLIPGKIGIAQRAERGNFRALDDLYLAVSVVEVDLPAVLCISLGRTRIVLAVV